MLVKPTDHENKVFDDGGKAFDNGLSLKFNPYNKKNNLHFIWMCGWQNRSIRSNNRDKNKNKS